MKNIKKYENFHNNNNIRVGKYVTFTNDISIDSGDFVIKAFTPYMINHVSNFSFSINYKGEHSLYINNDDDDVIFLPDNFTDEYLNILEQTYKYNL